MKEIDLTQGQVALVDDEDFEMLNQFKWFAQRKKQNFYAARKINVNGKQAVQRMHGEIMGRKGIDHIDHDGLNNQKANLRICTPSQNGMNRRPLLNTASTFKGVSIRNKKWKASIKLNGKQIHLGYFSNEAVAARAYDTKAHELFGEFCFTNF